MIAALAAYLALGFDFDCKAVSVRRALDLLSSQTGASLRATPALAGEIVFVHARNTNLEDLKSKIGETMNAAWRREGETDVLFRPNSMDRSIWRRHVEYRRTLVDEARAEARKRLAADFDAKSLARGLLALPSDAEVGTDQEAAKRRNLAQRSLSARSPLARLIDRLVLAANPDDLAAVGPYERRVFKIEPTAMQRGYDRPAYERALTLYASEQQAWIDEASKVSFTEPTGGSMVTDPRTQLEPAEPHARLSLEVKRGEMTALFSANLGKEGDGPFGYRIVNQTVFADPSRRFLDASMYPLAPPQGDAAVPLSDDSRTLLTAVTGALMSRKPASPTGRMRDLMLAPDRIDPLSLMVSDVFAAYAAKHRLNLIAAVPDAAFSILFFVARDGKNLQTDQTMQALVQSGSIRFVESGGWAVATPADPYEAALDFTPRSAVATLMKNVFDKGRLDVQDYARFAVESKRLNRGGFGEIYLAMFDRSLLGASDRTDWKALQLYGALTPAQREILESDGSILYRTMTPLQQALVDRIVYADRIGSYETDATGRIIGSSYNAVEPTESFASGVAGDAAISGKNQRKPAIVAYVRDDSGKPRPARSIDVWSLAVIEVESANDASMLDRYGMANLAGFAIGAEKVMSLRVEPRRNVWLQSTITIPDYPTDVSPVPWSQLPDPYPNQITALITQLKAQKTGQPGKTIPPGQH